MKVGRRSNIRVEFSFVSFELVDGKLIPVCGGASDDTAAGTYGESQWKTECNHPPRIS